MGVMITDGFDPGDDEKAVAILKKWKGGPLSDQLFTQIAQMTPQSGAIITFFRGKGKNAEVLLLPRPGDDPIWPNMLNLPGTIFRAGDFRSAEHPSKSALERIRQKELGVEFTTPPRFIGNVFQDTKRGYVTVFVYLGTLPEGAKGQTHWVWVPVNKLSFTKNYLTTEQSSIDLALPEYLKSQV